MVERLLIAHAKKLFHEVQHMSQDTQGRPSMQQASLKLQLTTVAGTCWVQTVPQQHMLNIALKSCHVTNT